MDLSLILITQRLLHSHSHPHILHSHPRANVRFQLGLLSFFYSEKVISSVFNSRLNSKCRYLAEAEGQARLSCDI